MLHPQLGTGLDPFASWQVDTDEIGDLAGLYDRQLADARSPEHLARLIGLLWKKLAATPRLGRLVVAYAEYRLAAVEGADRPGRPAASGATRRILAALRPAPARPALPPRLVFIEDDPLFDWWVDR